MKSLNLTVLLFCLVTYGYGRPSDTEERDDIIREAKREKYFQQNRLPYWAFVPTLGVWPDAEDRSSAGGTGDDAAAAPFPGAVSVNLDSGQVTVGNARPETMAPKLRPAARPVHPNTPSVGGPSWLRKTAWAAAPKTKTKDSAEEPGKDSADESVKKPVTKIYLKPSAAAKAGAGGVALSNPISTAVVRRGDTVSIEYLPDATAEAGEGGVAISRPELVIRLVD